MLLILFPFFDDVPTLQCIHKFFYSVSILNFPTINTLKLSFVADFKLTLKWVDPRYTRRQPFLLSLEFAPFFEKYNQTQLPAFKKF
jgi:hypothetical protein